MRFKIDWARLKVGSKFTIFALFYFVFEGSFSKYKPPGGLYLEGSFNGGFFALPVWGAYIKRGLYMEGFIFGILRYPRLSGIIGDTSGESGTFLFSRHVPDFCNDWRSFLTNENSNFFCQGCRQWISLITNLLNCCTSVPLSYRNTALTR